MWYSQCSHLQIMNLLSHAWQLVQLYYTQRARSEVLNHPIEDKKLRHQRDEDSVKAVVDTMLPEYASKLTIFAGDVSCSYPMHCSHYDPIIRSSNRDAPSKNRLVVFSSFKFVWLGSSFRILMQAGTSIQGTSVSSKFSLASGNVLAYGGMVAAMVDCCFLGM